MDFNSGQELLAICTEKGLPISAVMKERELANTGIDQETLQERLREIGAIFVQSATAPLTDPGKSMGGLIGGEAQKLHAYYEQNALPGGALFTKAITYSMAVLETNASMGLIVAAPTAGSSGVLPGVLLALKETIALSEEALFSGILNAGAIGYLAMRNASVSGAEAGCQAEVGVASAMAASAVTEIAGGNPQQCLTAASLSLSNLLGMVCDPIGGFVESPCQSRNALGAVNAITCAQLALSGVTHINPFDEMLDVMYAVGRSLSPDLRETARGGNAVAPTACAVCSGHCR